LEHLHHLLTYESEAEFVEDFKDEGKTLKGELLSTVDEIINFLKQAIEFKSKSRNAPSRQLDA
jgi:hypothetical protein